MTHHIRAIADADRAELRAFLDRHADTTLFLRSNLAEAGLHASAHPFGGCWAGAFEHAALVAVAAHFNGGNVVVAGGPGVEDAARLAVRSSGRPVRGVVGPWTAARSTLGALTLDGVPALESREVLYRLPLDRLRLPPALRDGRVRCRGARVAELEALADWRVAFEAESLARSPDARQRVQAAESIARAHQQGRLFVLEDEGSAAVASSAFNASADGIVQVGGVYTPPHLRGRGHGRAVVAGSLADAAARGAHRAILFTGETNHAARRAYEALGFEAIGDYGLLLF